MESMLVTQALDEKALLTKRINSAISSAKFIDLIRNNEDKTVDAKVTKETFISDAKAAYQSIRDLMNRYSKIDAAIIVSNATTILNLSIGKVSVAAAIAMRDRLRASVSGKMSNPLYDVGDRDFEARLYRTMTQQLSRTVSVLVSKNADVDGKADDIRKAVLGTAAKNSTTESVAVAEEYRKNNSYSLVDPLDLSKLAGDMWSESEGLLRELETAIKVSNASTLITID